MSGTVGLVTGAASGMGRLSTWRLASTGARVAAVDVDEEGLAGTASRAPSVVPLVCDVTDPESVAETVGRVERELGPIDRLVSAAAIAPTGRLLDQPAEVIAHAMDVNYVGSVRVVKAVVPGMVARGSGEVVQFASLAGWVPAPDFGAYSATKFATVAFTEVLHHEVRRSGVRVVCVCPPLVDTPMLDQVGAGSEALDHVTPIAPEVVIEAIEDALRRGDFWVFPGRGSTALWRLRRFLPGVLWRRIDQVSAR